MPSAWPAQTLTDAQTDALATAINETVIASGISGVKVGKIAPKPAPTTTTTTTTSTTTTTLGLAYREFDLDFTVNSTIISNKTSLLTNQPLLDAILAGSLSFMKGNGFVNTSGLATVSHETITLHPDNNATGDYLKTISKFEIRGDNDTMTSLPSAWPAATLTDAQVDELQMAINTSMLSANIPGVKL
eukprot:GSA120T00015495001.1